MHFLKPGDLVRVRIWKDYPYETKLGVICALSTRYKNVAQTVWYTVWTPHGVSVYFPDEIELVSTNEI